MRHEDSQRYTESRACGDPLGAADGVAAAQRGWRRARCWRASSWRRCSRTRSSCWTRCRGRASCSREKYPAPAASAWWCDALPPLWARTGGGNALPFNNPQCDQLMPFQLNPVPCYGRLGVSCG